MVQDRKSGKPTTGLRADTIRKSTTERGESFTRGEPGDTRAISEPKRGGVINERRTRRYSYYKQAETANNQAKLRLFYGLILQVSLKGDSSTNVGPEMLAPSW